MLRSRSDHAPARQRADDVDRLSSTVGSSSPSHRSLYREILSHTATYAVGTIANGVAAVLLLPLYTRYLSTWEYGAVAILDLTTQLLAIVLGGGLTTAALRFSSDARSQDDRGRVWGTAFVYATAMGVVALALGYAGSPFLARWTLGSERYAHFYQIIFLSFLPGMIASVPNTYLVATKRSTLASLLSIGRLLVSVGMNIVLIILLGWGIDGFLYAGLVASTLFAITTSAYMLSHTGLSFSRRLFTDMLRFGAPLVPAVLCAAVMHEGDRFILPRYVGLSEVGIYSVGYKIAMMTSFLVVVPFSMTWNAVLYDVNRRSDAPDTYARIMTMYTCFILLVMVTLSLFAKEVVELLTGPEFHQAYRVVPIVSLGYVFYSMHDHFKVSSFLTKKTSISMIVFGAGAGSNLLLNLALIPSWGYMGAAAATAISFAIFAGTALVCYSRLYSIPYPLARMAFVLLASLPCFGAGIVLGASNGWSSLVVRIAALIAFAVLVLWIALRNEVLAANRNFADGWNAPALLAACRGRARP